MGKKAKKLSTIAETWHSEAKPSESEPAMDSIRDADAYFKRLIDLIPVDSWGFDEDVQDRLRKRKHELLNRKDPEKKRRLNDKERQKLQRDSACRTVSEVWQWLDVTGQFENRPIKPGVEGLITASASTAAKSAPNGAAPAATAGKKRKARDSPSVGAAASSPSAAAAAASGSTREEALRRLKQKIEQLRGKRGAKSAFEHEESRKLKRRMSKIQLKERRRLAKADAAAEQAVKAEATSAVAENAPDKKAQAAVAPVRNAEGNLVFNKFDFVQSQEARDKANAETQSQRRKANRNKFQGKDFKRLLDKTEARRKKVERLQEKDPEKAGKLEMNMRWDAATQRAEGVKVKDNAELLRKSLKRKEQRKGRSEQKWHSREHTVQQNQQKRQEQRRQHIDQRRQQKRQKKLQKLRKKGRNV